MRNCDHQHLWIAAIVLFMIVCPMDYTNTTRAELRAASVLSTQFETLVYTNTDLLASVEDLNAQLHSREQVLSNRALRLPFAELIGALTAVGKTTVNDLKQNYGSVLLGATDFVSPDGVGMVASRKCYIAVARSGTEPLTAFSLQKATPSLVRGIDAVTWSIPPFEGHSRPTEFYAVFIRGTYFVLANDRHTFEEAVQQLRAKRDGKPLVLPNGSPGAAVFGGHDYWAYRVLDRSRAKDVNAAGIDAVPSNVLALAFIVDSANNKSFINIYSFADVAPIFLRSTPAPVQTREAGVWRSDVVLSNAESTQDILLAGCGKKVR